MQLSPPFTLWLHSQGRPGESRPRAPGWDWPEGRAGGTLEPVAPPQETDGCSSDKGPGSRFSYVSRRTGGWAAGVQGSRGVGRLWHWGHGPRGDQALWRARHLGAWCWGLASARGRAGGAVCPRAPSGREGAPSGGLPGNDR